MQPAVAASVDRTRLFASQELAVNVLALVLQVVVTGPLLARAGVGVALALTPLVRGEGFLELAPRLAMAVVPMLGLVMAFHVVRRAVHDAFERPARETLYAVVAPRRITRQRR